MKVDQAQRADTPSARALEGLSVPLHAEARPSRPIAAGSARLRPPNTDDGADIWALVKDTNVLDVNSAYSYVMLGEYFSETCVVAEQRDRLVGFVSAFVPPSQDDTVFVWQVAVSRRASGRGLAKAMLREVLGRPACEDVRYLEATVTPSNKRSAQLFRAFARDLESPCTVAQGFPSAVFPGESHEPERLFRIGPFS